MPYEPTLNVKEMSLLHWVEHCIECAAPSCYQSCDLYQPRFDLRCRRFTYGAIKNKNFASLRGYGVEISFKKWAKMEAFGNLALMPVGVVRWIERLAEWSAPIGSLIGKLMARVTGKPRWYSATHIGFDALVRRLARNKRDIRIPEAFLLEVYNPVSETVRMQLSFVPVKDANNGKSDLVQMAPSFVKTLTFPSGYSSHEIGLSLLSSVIETGRPFVISMVPEADNNARLVFLTADFVRFVAEPSRVKEKNKVKCVVWDLDNTLWDGVLIEGDAIAIRPEMISLLRHLDGCGILLSIASKNDHSSAWRKLEQLGVSEYFLYPQIKWGPKSESIRTIAERLNIGLDAVAFVDDNPFELDEVARALPGVVCVNARETGSLLTDTRFAGSTSTESGQRRKLYRDAMVRERDHEKFGQDYRAFLASCELKLEIIPYNLEFAERVAELVQRTNQLNFSGHKYTRAQLDEILLNPDFDKLILKCSDRYGSYGTVGFGLVQTRGKVIRVHDFMLSCRVQGKLIEQAFFDHLLRHHNPESSAVLWVNFRPTDRNKPAQQVLESLGFSKCNAASDQLSDGVILISPDSLRCEIIQVHCSFASFPVTGTVISLAQNPGAPQISAKSSKDLSSGAARHNQTPI